MLSVLLCAAMADVVHLSEKGVKELDPVLGGVKKVNSFKMKLPEYLEEAKYYNIEGALRAGNSLEMTPSGPAPETFYVVTYHCGHCSKAVGGGFNAQLVSTGWEARGGSCAPTFETENYDAHPMMVFRKELPPGTTAFLNATTHGLFVGVFSVIAQDVEPCPVDASRAIPTGPQQPAPCKAFCISSPTTLTTTVHIDGLGDVTGVIDTLRGQQLFLGIPYAERFEPFKQARMNTSWPGGVLNATTYGEMCYQPGSPDVRFGCHNGSSWGPAWNTLHLEKSGRNCLNLNVFVPLQQQQGPLPVMVFIPGGGFYAGGANDEQLWHSFGTNVILVTMNYRLGVQGFGFLNSMKTETGYNGGNFGVRDQRMALSWVSRYVTAFNGNPGKVTLFGESAGGTSVAFHYTSKESQPLFHQAILESAGTAQVNTQDWTIANTLLLASTIGHSEAAKHVPAVQQHCPIDQGQWTWTTLPDIYYYADCLSNKSIVIPKGTGQNICEQDVSCFGYIVLGPLASEEEVLFMHEPLMLYRAQAVAVLGGPVQGHREVSVKLMHDSIAFDCLKTLGSGTQAEQALLVRYTTYIDVHPDTFYHNMWSPFPDGVTLLANITDLIVDGAGADIPVMIGTNLDEGTLFMSGITHFIGNDSNKAEYEQWMIDTFGQKVGASSTPDYLPDELTRPFPSAHGDYWVSAMRAGTDSQFACRAYELLHNHDANAPHYLYQFTHTSQSDLAVNGSMYGYGSYHGLELEYLFHYNHSAHNTKDEVELMDTMSCFWQNFAATGNPNDGQHCSSSFWPEYSSLTGQTLSYLQLDTYPFMQSHPYTNAERCIRILAADPVSNP